MSFIHFGCWNQGNCDIERGKNGMSLVMKSLIKANLKPSFYVISGDNYYPDKFKYIPEDISVDSEKVDPKKDKGYKKKSRFSLKNLESGFTCALELTKQCPVYMLMGNHDLGYEEQLYFDKSSIPDPLIDTEQVYTEKFLDERLNKYPESESRCLIINSEVKYKDPFNFNRYSAILNKHSICLFINTSFYNGDENKSLDCFKKYREDLYGSFTKIETIEMSTIIIFEEKLLEYLLDIYIKKFPELTNLIIFGHDPILTRRNKKNKDGSKPIYKPLNWRGLKFLNSLCSKLTCKKYYLCADTHHYQKATIKLGENIIEQYVCGTGGTELDEDGLKCERIDNYDIEEITTHEYECGTELYIDNPVKEKSNKEKFSIKSYHLERVIESFGYLYCSSNEKELDFKFVRVPSLEGGKRSKTISKKKKSRKHTSKFKKYSHK